MLNNYTVSLYIRLSNEDENVGESNSIKNQRDLLTEFISKHPELSKYRLIEHCDDGYSGVNFNRPAVTQMLQKVRKGEINCIVVKDFSRFGRNYIEVGDYLEQVFPFLDVRFISVNDNYDSDRKNGTIGDIEVALRTLIYDLYSKDLSVKIKSAKRSKMKRGEFISSYAPYGFKKSDTVKNRLEIDEEAAKVVRYIFELAALGKSTIEIAKNLNIEKIPSPNEYKALTNSGRNWAWASHTGTIWDSSYINNMLSDERYIGSAVSNKTERIKVGSSAMRRLPKEEWIIIPDVYNAIVSKELFNEVQKRDFRVSQKVKPYRLFQRKIRCHYCNRVMARQNVKNDTYLCRTAMLSESPNCFDGAISEQLIHDIVLSAIHTQAHLFAKAKKAEEKQKNIFEKKINNLKQCIQQFQNDIVKRNVAKQECYENYKDEYITKDEYLDKRKRYNEQIDEISEQVANLEEKINDFFMQVNGQSISQSEWSEALNIKELNREIIESLIDSIIVYDSNRIEIKWKYADGFKF